MLFIVSDDEGQSECCLLCQMIKAKVSVVCVSDNDGQGWCCLLCQMMKARVSVVSSGR